MSFKSVIKDVSLKLWHLVPEPNGRAYVFVTMLMSLLTTSVVTLVVFNYENGVSDSRKSVDNFIALNESLDKFVSVYLSAVRNNQSVTGSTTNDISSNLVDQFHAVESIKQYLPQTERSLAAEYQQRLIDFKQVLPDSQDILDMQDFVNNYRKVLLTEQNIRDDLKR